MLLIVFKGIYLCLPWSSYKHNETYSSDQTQVETLKQFCKMSY